jgi:hypothetical protein
MKITFRLTIFFFIFLVAGIGCTGKSSPTSPPYHVTIDPADFVSGIDNPYLPMVSGTIFTYQGETGGHPEINKVTITHQTKIILGVTCIVVADTVLVDSVLSEATSDWYAQDIDGNVWYFGEASKEFENGVVISTEGSWEAGVNGAQPGIVMLANPDSGHSYRQEYLEDEAEDMAEVLSLSESVTVPYGSFQGCLMTIEWTPLEPGIAEHKYYKTGVGTLSIVTVTGGSDHSELVSVTIE